MNLNQANDLIDQYISLKEQVSNKPSKKNLNEFLKHERICLEQFKYIISSKTNKYKQYPNYDDLNQEGLDALLQAMNSFQPGKGNIFWWIHKYIDTRIARTVRLHTAIKYPLKFIQTVEIPAKVSKMPSLLTDHSSSPEALFENKETWNIINKTISTLSKKQKTIVKMAFGIDGNQPHSITHISNKMKLSKVACEKLLETAVIKIKQAII